MTAKYTRIDNATPPAAIDARGSVVVIGNFDGVHRGHVAVLARAVGRAQASSLGVCVLTFDPHPAVALGRPPPPALTTLDRRAELIAEAGVSHIYVRTFDADFAATPAERFVEELLVGWLGARVVEVGDNFRFGAGARGGRVLLDELGRRHGFVATTCPLEGDEKGAFSSSRARQAIARGDLDDASRVLGRPHEIAGVVVHGQKLGRQLGWPTANLDGIAELLPADGIYAARVFDLSGSGQELGAGALSIGVRPTIGSGLARTVEVFVLDAPVGLDLYGRRLRLAIEARLRGELRFEGTEQLKVQIAQDVEDVRRVLAREPAKR